MKLRDMTLLVRIAETGSLSLTARQLHLSPAAVSGALRKVEAELGLRLFERTTRSVRPTAEGQHLVAGCRTLLAGWSQLLEETRGQQGQLRGEVRISAPADTVHGYLAGIIVGLCEAHPSLHVIFDISDAVQPLQQQAIDLAFRFGALPDSGLTVRRLGVLPTVLVAAPGYLETHGTPHSPTELTAHRCLTLHQNGAPMRTWPLGRVSAEAPLTPIPVRAALCGDGHLVRQLAIAGQGIALKSLFDVIDDLEAGRLRRVLPEYQGEALPLQLVFPSRQHQPRRVRVVADWITERLQARVARCG